jgi:hypothetical protein
MLEAALTLEKSSGAANIARPRSAAGILLSMLGSRDHGRGEMTYRSSHGGEAKPAVASAVATRQDTGSRSKGFGSQSVELDTMSPQNLRDIVELMIEQHLTRQQFEILKNAEASKQQMLRHWVERNSAGA